MKLLITGGAGFIGSNFILDRIEKGDKVRTDAPEIEQRTTI